MWREEFESERKREREREREREFGRLKKSYFYKLMDSMVAYMKPYYSSDGNFFEFTTLDGA